YLARVVTPAFFGRHYGGYVPVEKRLAEPSAFIEVPMAKGRSVAMPLCAARTLTEEGSEVRNPLERLAAAGVNLVRCFFDNFRTSLLSERPGSVAPTAKLLSPLAASSLQLRPSQTPPAQSTSTPLSVTSPIASAG
ncbi:hypothetical protein AK812_SmicGene47926, partial [Symbiodinium microadriaticum]